ncbi:hypothetical protein SAMN05444722_1372 [Rhodovulum sp. ES.010]|uniref:hypothetical protein n=1 Tax=Rhodovulum sp. ES.010 TaxID=1882821 RepID=UPI0009287521|nr:hypothetical protein [Rhodovulum sp. ES.010]SIO31266.1 hypothetical protein SAMN05444722_1372 [Rhodovulum sp. ES.010]
MTRNLSEMEHLSDAAEALGDIRARRPAIARFHSEAVLAHTGASTVFRGRYDEAGAILTLALGTDRRERARRHQRILARLGAALGDGRYRVAPLIDAWPGEGVTLTADPAGEALIEAVDGADDDTRDALLGEAGHWLDRVTAAAHRQVAFGGRQWVRRARTGLARIASRDDRALGAALGNRLEALLPTVAGRAVTQAHGHGDFSPAHVVRTQDAIVAIAVQPSHWPPVTQELARFLVALQIARPRPGGAARFGVDGADHDALLAPVERLPRAERARHLPFFIGIELADRLEQADLAGPEADRLRDAIEHFLNADRGPTL